jgi:hypothetical protein
MYSGNEYLWAAGLWVGAMVDGQPRVTTGSYDHEFLPTDAPADTIYHADAGAPGGNRYPWPDADDDGDGREDEDLPNGLDDDGDGLVDEDFAAFGDQQFVCAYNDREAALQATHPDHAPLGISVVQRSVQWGGPRSEDFIGYDFTITNVGDDLLENVYLGLFSDCDIGSRGLLIADNDYAGYVSTLAPAMDGTVVPVRIAYMYDGPSTFHVDGYVGWVLCSHTTDAAGVAAPPEPVVTGYQCLTGNAAFESGGDPEDDTQRYQLLSAHEQDPDVPQLHYGDYRVLMASGPFATLAPGQSLSYRVALVLGAGLDEMIVTAAEAVATARGVAYDRDGDPVGWPREYALAQQGAGGSLMLDEARLGPPAAAALALRAGPNPFNPLVTIHYELPRESRALLQVFDLRGHAVRTLLDGVLPAGGGSLDWRGIDDAGHSLASGVYQLRLSTDGAVAETRVTLVR